jgi:hypothetical protein
MADINRNWRFEVSPGCPVGPAPIYRRRCRNRITHNEPIFITRGAVHYHATAHIKQGRRSAIIEDATRARRAGSPARR